MTTETACRAQRLLIAARHRIVHIQRVGHKYGPARWCLIVAAPWIEKGHTIGVCSPRQLHGFGIPVGEIDGLIG